MGNATLELGQQKLLKHIAQLAAENAELKRSAEERKKLRSGEARLNKMHSELKSEAKKLANGYDADGFPIPPLRPKANFSESPPNLLSSKVWMRSQTRTHSKCGHMRRLKAAFSTSEKATNKPE